VWLHAAWEKKKKVMLRVWWHTFMRCRYIHESCHTFELVMSHMWMSHVTHMNECGTIMMWHKSLCHNDNLCKKNNYTNQILTSHSLLRATNHYVPLIIMWHYLLALIIMWHYLLALTATHCNTLQQLLCGTMWFPYIFTFSSFVSHIAMSHVTLFTFSCSFHT